MTIPTMTFVKAFLLVALVLFSGCAQDGGAPEGPGADLIAATEAAESAAEAAKAVAVLEGRVAELEDELAAAEAGSDDAVTTMAARMKKVRERMWSSIADLRASLISASSDADSAAGEAQRALGEVASALRQLNVLEDRFDYHVNKQHGGG